MPMTNAERLNAEVKLVFEAFASGEYVLRGNSDGGESYLYRVCDGMCIGISDDVMQYLIAEELIKFMPQP
jgi:hypothetical protein